MEIQNVLFYAFVFVVAVSLYIPALTTKSKTYSWGFTILSSMAFMFLAFQLASYTILLLVFIGIVLIQIISLISLGKGE